MVTIRRALTPATIRSLVHQLGVEPCPVCAEAEASVRSWFAAYAAETNADPDMQAALRDSGGLCPAHTRRLLDQGVASSWLATGLFADLARTGIRRLDGGGLPGGVCPPCASAARRASGMLHLVRLGLRQSAAVRDAYAAGPGACWTHAVHLLVGADVASARLVVGALLHRLASEPPSQSATLIGLDTDERRRGRQWAQRHEAVLAAEERSVKASTTAYLEAMLATPACPLCTAAVRAAWRFLGWLGTCGISPRELRLDAALCPTHLSDLGTIAGRKVADEFVAYNAERTAAELSHAESRLQGLTRRRSPNAVFTPKRAVAAALAPALRGTPCRACTVSARAEQAELRLVRIAAADPARSAAVAQAHGVCLRDALRLAAAGELDPPWRAVIDARLRLLSYALDAAVQHAGWDSRWKVHGAEMGAWQHAADLLDGAVLGPRTPEPPPA